MSDAAGARGAGEVGAERRGAGQLAVGDPAPTFALTDQHLQVVRLEDFRGRRKVLLVFYPLTFTSVCGGELTTLRDQLPAFEKDEVTVLGISTDTSAVHRAYIDREYLGYSLLSDFWPHGAAAQAYGVFNAETGFADRGSFLIDVRGILRWSVRAEFETARSVDDYRAAIAAL